MRLKRVICLSLLVSLVSSSAYKQDYQCAHDGYSTSDGKCECTKSDVGFSFYSGSKCTTMECTNMGVRIDDNDDNNQRCSCPPGFLGTHCEPTHCVPGNVKSFDEVSHGRDVSLIITYNQEFQEQLKEKDKDPNLPKTICDAIMKQDGVTKDSKIHFWIFQTDFATNTEECEADFIDQVKICDKKKVGTDYIYDCEGDLTTSYILDALATMDEDSRLIIFANEGITDENPADGIEAIRKKAISLRTQIHSLVLSPRTINNNNIYFSGEYGYLKDLSESTLGFYINPFDASGGQRLGDSGIKEILDKMMIVFFEYVVVDRITTEKDTCDLYSDFTVFHTMEATEDKPFEFWVTVTSNGGPYSKYATTWVGPLLGKNATVDAGFFKGYTLPAKTGETVVLYPTNKMPNGKCVPTTVMVLARSKHLARFAITNDDAIDAYSPYAISGAKNTLVGHFVEYYHEDHLNSLYLELTNDNFKTDVKKEPIARDCQYNAKFDDVACDEGQNTLIRVRNKDSGVAVTVQSLYCTEPEKKAQLSMQDSQLHFNSFKEVFAAKCTPIIEVKKEKALILAAHATKNIANLFSGSSKSAIRYLNDLDDQNHYTQYVLNIFNAADFTDAENVDEYSDFKALLMNKWNVIYKDTKDEDCKAKLDVVVPLQDILSTRTTVVDSDLIFIIDRGITASNHLQDDLKYLQKQMYQKRLRLIVLLLGCSSSGEDFNDSAAVKYWNTVATRTGGFMVHFETPESLNEFFASYVDWVKGETAATIDGDDSAFYIPTITSTPFQVQEGKNYTFLVNTVPAVTSPVTVSSASGDESIEKKTLLGNSLSIYEYQASEDGVLTVKATAAPSFFYGSIRVLEVTETDYATIGFTEETCLASTYPDYNPQHLQYPVTNTVENANVTMTIFTSKGEILRTGEVEDPIATSYPLDYNWRCNENAHVYYISADVVTETSTFTRTITTECFGSGLDKDKCQNGIYIAPSGDAKEGTCECPHEYTGDICDRPVCQNGGVVTAALTCDCTIAGDDYTGDFCEIYKKCADHESFTPSYRSIPTTIIFLFEKSKFVIDRIREVVPALVPDPDPAPNPVPGLFDDARSAQYLIVEYGPESNYSVRLSTTDKDILYGELQLFVDENKLLTGDDDAADFDVSPAIKAALQAQTTDSAHIFWFAKDDSVSDSFVSDVFDPVAANRVTFSALFGESLSLTNVHPVTLAGGSIFYSGKDTSAVTDYVDFFNNYVLTLLAYQPGFELRLNMISISTACNAVHTINIDQTVKWIFVAADSATGVTLQKEGKDTAEAAPAPIPGGYLYVSPQTGAYTITIKHATTACVSEDESPVNRTSSVSAMTSNQVAYGFYRSDDSSKFEDSAMMGGNVLVTYWLAEGTASAPSAVITPFTVDGAGESTTLFMTKRDECSFTLSVPINCTGDADAYGVKITNSIIAKGGTFETKVDKYIPVLCLSSHSCHNGGQITDEGCVCEDFYGGDFCEIDECANGERTDGKCVCNTGYSGDACETFTVPEDRSGISYLFIQDVCGTDMDLTDSAQWVYENYLPLLDTSAKIFLATNQKGSGVVPVSSLSDLQQKMTDNKLADGTTCAASIGDALNAFYEVLRQPSLAMIAVEAAADTSVGKANVAHVTTVPIDGDQGTRLPKLKTDFLLTMEFVGLTYKNEYFPSPNGFEDFPGEFLETYDKEVALIDLGSSLGSKQKIPLPSPADVPRCIQKLQAAIGFHTDISSVTYSAEYRNKAQQIFQSVTKYFTLPPVKTIDIDDETCEFDKSQEADASLFYGSIYANSSSIINPTFCMSNMDSYPANVATANYKQAAQVTLQSVIDSYTKWYNSDTKMICHCFDYQNTDTTKIILWTPLSPTSLDADYSKVNFKGFDLAKFTHVVMPFGFDYEGSPVWRNLVPDQDLWLSDASKANYDVEEIIQDIWSIICRLAGRIDSDQTAEPFNPYTTKKPKTGDDTKKDDENTTDDPKGDGDDLPR